MIVEGDPKLTPIVDKQFEILGIALRMADIPESGVIQVGKRKDYWYDIYRLTEEQDKEWRDWMRKEIEDTFDEDTDEIMAYLLLRYGLPISYKRTGELF